MKSFLSLLFIAGFGTTVMADDIAVFVRTSKLAETFNQETTLPGPATGQRPFRVSVTEQTYEIIDLTTRQHVLIEVYERTHPDFNAKTYFLGTPQAGTYYSQMPIKPAGNFLWYRLASESSEIALDLDGEDSIDDYFGTGHLIADEQGRAGKIKVAGKDLFLPRSIALVEDIVENYTSTFDGGAKQETGVAVRKVTGRVALNTALTTQANTAPNDNLAAATTLVVNFLVSRGYAAGTP